MRRSKPLELPPSWAEQPDAYATLTEDEARQRIESGEISRDDLSIAQREQYRDELKKKYGRYGRTHAL